MNEEKLRNKLEVLYHAWDKKEPEYREDKKILEDAFNTEFVSERPPTFFAGNLDADIVIIGLNPGYSKKEDEEDWEKQQKEQSFEDYWNFSREFYKRCANREDKDMTYYERFSKFIRGLKDDDYKDSTTHPEYLEYLQGDLLNLDLIPFHSNGIDNFNPEDEKGREVLEKYAELVTEIVQMHDRDYVIITGKDNWSYWEEKLDIELETAGSWNKKVNYGKKHTEFFDADTIVLEQFFTKRGLSTMERYLLGVNCRLL